MRIAAFLLRNTRLVAVLCQYCFRLQINLLKYRREDVRYRDKSCVITLSLSGILRRDTLKCITVVVMPYKTILNLAHSTIKVV